MVESFDEAFKVLLGHRPGGEVSLDIIRPGLDVVRRKADQHAASVDQPPQDREHFGGCAKQRSQLSCFSLFFRMCRSTLKFACQFFVKHLASGLKMELEDDWQSGWILKLLLHSSNKNWLHLRTTDLGLF